MLECPECEEKIDDDEVEFECQECGEEDMGEGFYTCKSCGTRFDLDGELWECQFCCDEIIGFHECRCPDCDEILEDESYCFNCGWPNNQGWIGEHYG